MSNLYLGLISLSDRLQPLKRADTSDLEKSLDRIKLFGDEDKEFYVHTLDTLCSLVHAGTKYRSAVEEIQSLTSEASKKVKELSDKLPYSSEVFANQVTLDIPFPALFDEIESHQPQPEFPQINYPNISGRALIEKIDELRANDRDAFDGEFHYNRAKVKILKRHLTNGKYELTFTDVDDALTFAQRIDALAKKYKK